MRPVPGGRRLGPRGSGLVVPAAALAGAIALTSPAAAQRLDYRFTTAARQGLEGEWGGTIGAVGSRSWSLGEGRWAGFGRLGGTVDRGRGRTEGEIAGTLGIERRAGRAVLRLGVGGVGAGPNGGFVVGGLASTTIALGHLTVDGEVGRFVNVRGSVADPLQDGSLESSVDTGSVGNAAQAMSHAMLGAVWRNSRLALGARVLRRSSFTLENGVGWEASLATRVAPTVWFRVSGGRTPAMQGIYLPFRQRLSLGFELHPRPAPPARRPDPAFPLLPIGGMVIEPAGLGLTAIVLRLPAARTVEIAGDFTDWRPIRLDRIEGGSWRIRIPIPPGSHLINLRVDGGPWEVPGGLAAADDGFGGRAGVMLVRE